MANSNAAGYNSRVRAMNIGQIENPGHAWLRLIHHVYISDTFHDIYIRHDISYHEATTQSLDKSIFTGLSYPFWLAYSRI